MGILIFLVPLAVIMSAAAAGAWFWACRDSQFDDLESPAYKMLIDDTINEDEV